jgi:hypothetical protein
LKSFLAWYDCALPSAEFSDDLQPVHQYRCYLSMPSKICCHMIKRYASCTHEACGAAWLHHQFYGAMRTPCSVSTKVEDVLSNQGKQELMALRASSLALAFGSADDRAQSAESFWAAASCSLHPSRWLSVICTLKLCTPNFLP